MKVYLHDVKNKTKNYRPFIITADTPTKMTGQLLRDVDFAIMQTHRETVEFSLRSEEFTYNFSYLVDHNKPLQEFVIGNGVRILFSFTYHEYKSSWVLDCPMFTIYKQPVST